MSQIDAVMDAIIGWQERPFTYGESDCCQFVGHVYAIANGRDYLPYAYHSESEAAELLAKYGGLGSLVSSVLEKCHVAPRWLRAGDLALCDTNDSETLGIVLSSGVVVTVRAPDGKLAFLPKDAINYGWRIE